MLFNFQIDFGKKTTGKVTNESDRRQHIKVSPFCKQEKDFIKKLIKLFFKDTHREKARSNKTPALAESTNMGIWTVGTSTQLFIGS